MTTQDTRNRVYDDGIVQEILKAATEVFNTHGFGKATMSDIAERLGLTTTELAQYYRCKEELVAACVTDATDRLERLLTAAEREPGRAEDRLARLIRLFFDGQAQIRSKARPPVIKFWELRTLAGPSALVVRETVAQVFRRFRLIFADPEGPTFSRPEQNARTFLVFASLLYAMEWLNLYDGDDFSRCADQLVDVMINGFAAPNAAWAPGSGRTSANVTADGESTEDAFLRAATELINEQGYRGVSAAGIGSILDIDTAVLHRGHARDDLVIDCFARSFNVVRAAHQATSPGTGDGWERLCAMTISLVRYQFSSHGPLLHSMALAATPSPARARIFNTLCALANRTAGVIVDGMADGSIRPVDPCIAAHFISGMTNTALELKNWVVDLTPEMAIELFVRPALFGIFIPSVA